MTESNSSPLPTFESLGNLIEFFETEEMSEYWEQLPEAHFDVDIQHRMRLVAIDEGLFEKLAAIAASQQVSTEELIDSYLREKAG